VASYEEKQREVLQENRDLRLALESLQGEHRAIGNQQVPPPSPLRGSSHVCWVAVGSAGAVGGGHNIGAGATRELQ